MRGKDKGYEDDYELSVETIAHCKLSKKKVEALSRRLLKVMQEMDEEGLYLFGGTWGINVTTIDGDCVVAAVGASTCVTSGGCGAIQFKNAYPGVQCIEGSEYED